jgi:hypothetical protein
MKECPFHLRASKYSRKNYWQVVSYNVAQECYSTGKNRLCKTKLVDAKFVTIMMHTPNMKLSALQEECITRWGVMLANFRFIGLK